MKIIQNLFGNKDEEADTGEWTRRLEEVCLAVRNPLREAGFSVDVDEISIGLGRYLITLEVTGDIPTDFEYLDRIRIEESIVDTLDCIEVEIFPYDPEHGPVEKIFVLVEGIDYPDPNEAGSVEELYPQAEEIVKAAGRASTSMLQRRMRLGYSKSAQLIGMLEENGVIEPYEEGSATRVVK